jgi:hypothetical protein
MSVNRDYIPMNDQGFLAWGTNFTNNLKEIGQAVKIETTSIIKLEGVVNAYAQALIKARDLNRGRLDTKRKNEKKAAARKAIKTFIRERIAHNEDASAEHLELLGIPTGKKQNALHKLLKLKSCPEAKADTSIQAQITFRYIDSLTRKRARPEGIIGAEINWLVSQTPPASDEEMTYSQFVTSSPCTLNFREDQRGHFVYYRFRWFSRRKNCHGPWSKIEKAVIA